MIKAAFRFTLQLLSVLLTSYAVVNFGLFLSLKNGKIYTNIYPGTISEVLRLLIVDMLLIVGFVLIHTFLALSNFKKFFLEHDIGYLWGVIYSSCSSMSLLALTTFWQHTSRHFIWNIEMENFKTFLNIVHIFAWLMIFGECFVMDIGRLQGIQNVGSPKQSSPSLVRFYSHISHPSVCMLALLFCASPIMTFDRMLLTAMLSLYMYVAWNPDVYDFDYHKNQYLTKLRSH